MPVQEDPIDTAKRAAAIRACDFVEDGMIVGLGTGSTAAHMVRELGRRAREGLRITGVPTSDAAAALAREEGIPLTDLDGEARPDLTIDGADEADAALNLIKGGGGALLREKIVAVASRRMIAIADASKQVAALGAFPLPVEVVPFGIGATRAAIAEVLAGADVLGHGIMVRQREGEAFRTDGGHMILDLALRRIGNPGALDTALKAVPGVVETGLFCGICDLMVLGHGDGRTELVDAYGPRGTSEADNAFSDI
jgi:ribose 5-phosphate isomerase A